MWLDKNGFSLITDLKAGGDIFSLAVKQALVISLKAPRYIAHWIVNNFAPINCHYSSTRYLRANLQLLGFPKISAVRRNFFVDILVKLEGKRRV